MRVFLSQSKIAYSTHSSLNEANTSHTDAKRWRENSIALLRIKSSTSAFNGHENFLSASLTKISSVSFRTSSKLIFWISIHAPRMGCDTSKADLLDYAQWLFQSTHPAWGATVCEFILSSLAIIFQSTHPAWGATPLCYWFKSFLRNISIHAPRMGCDILSRRCLLYAYRDFNPRTPHGVRLNFVGLKTCGDLISIHAPRMGCDLFQRGLQRNCPNWHFNPRTPHGVRLTARA